MDPKVRLSGVLLVVALAFIALSPQVTLLSQSPSSPTLLPQSPSSPTLLPQSPSSPSHPPPPVTLLPQPPSSPSRVSVQVASASLVKSDQIRSSKDVIGQVVEFEAEEIEALEGGNARPHAAGLESGDARPHATALEGSERGGGEEGVTEGRQQEEERSWWRWDVGKGELVWREGPEGLADGQETLLWLPEIVYEDLELMDLRYFQGLHCPAPACPSFARCRTGRRQAGRVLACTGHDPLLSDPLSRNNGGASSQTASTDASGTSSVGASGSDSMATVGSASAAGLGSASVDASPLVDPSPVLTSPPPNHVKDNATYDVAVAEPFAAQVFLLENVFINDRGMVFDAMYHYRHGLLCREANLSAHVCSELLSSTVFPLPLLPPQPLVRSCPLDFGLYTGNETKVHVYSELLSLANWNGGNFYHSLLEVMPSLLYLWPFLEAKPGIPIPVKIDQVIPSLLHLRPFLEAKLGIPIPVKIDQDKHARLFSLININASTLNFQTVRKDHLFFARRLLLPSIAQCGRPSAALVRHLRNHYLLPPSAPRIKSRHELAQFSSYATATTVPVTAAATDVAAAGNAGTDATAAAASDGAGLAAGGGVLATPDWCVVVGQRDTTRRIVGRTHILEELQAFFPKERIMADCGANTHIGEAAGILSKREYCGEMEEYCGEMEEYCGEMEEYCGEMEEYCGEMEEYCGEMEEYCGEMEEYCGEMEEYCGE
ncbi:unnamed protein product [Closterium sp. NIES-64]|nr:unnamed protein product [Closterium sp. NIES-64]